jgi:leucyl/phenylalanyl-tRNA--protein transferase
LPHPAINSTRRGLDALRSTIHPLTRSVLRYALSIVGGDPTKTAKLIYAIAEECPHPPETAEEATLRLQGLRPLDERVLVGQYVQGRVPYGYYHEEETIYWRQPDARGLITPEAARLPRSVKRQMDRLHLDIEIDVDREEIIRRCRRVDGTWLNEAMIRALLAAADHGLCTTLGGYQDGVLVAGEFGLDLGGWYFSMSTFHTVPGAGNAVFGHVVSQVRDRDRFVVCDVGEMKAHSAQFGAVETPSARCSALLLAHLGSARRGTGPTA